MHTTFFALLAMGAGAAIAIQASANGNFRKSLGDNPLFAAFFSICGTFLTAVVAMLVLRPAAPSAEALREAPWWNWMGGPLGALIVLAGAALTRELGAALFIALAGGMVGTGQVMVNLASDYHVQTQFLDAKAAAHGEAPAAPAAVKRWAGFAGSSTTCSARPSSRLPQ